MKRSTSSTPAGSLLHDLKELHQQLASEPAPMPPLRPAPAADSVPLLDDVVSIRSDAQLSLQQELVIRSAERILPQVIEEFTPLIAKELSSRLRQEMRQIMHSQSLRNNSEHKR